MKKEEDLFIEFLRGRGLKVTGQRLVILRTFLAGKGHISCEELYKKARGANPNIGQATVFRALKLLEAAGLARGVELGDRRARFEHDYGRQHHDHLVCTECGCCVEVADARIEKLQNELCRKSGFASRGHRLKIFGLCRACLEKKKGDKSPK